jgi:hypothetical protein
MVGKADFRQVFPPRGLKEFLKFTFGVFAKRGVDVIIRNHKKDVRHGTICFTPFCLRLFLFF